MSNKNLGNKFESEFCDLLFQHGYWVHNLAQNASGQPADVIAVKNRVAYLIDCKVCSNNKFPFSRVEENQDLSMALWEKCGNGQGWFAFQLKGKVFMIPRGIITYYRERQAGLSEREIQIIGIPLSSWVEEVTP